RTYTAALRTEQEIKLALERKNWVGAAQATLSEQIQGDLTLEEVGRRALDDLAKETGARIGALYVAEPEGMRLLATHARDVSAKKRFDRGEGLVGQVAVDQGLIHLKDVPRDFPKVRSGIGERRPTEVVLVPACVDRATCAVVELGFLRPVSDDAIELLGRVGE